MLSFSSFSSSKYSAGDTVDALFEGTRRGAPTSPDGLELTVLPALSNMTTHASSSLVSNLYDNHETFIAISQHIDALRGSSRALRSSLSSLTHAVDALGAGYPDLVAAPFAPPPPPPPPSDGASKMLALPASLEALIAERKFALAVDMVLEARGPASTSSPAYPYIKDRIDAAARELIEKLTDVSLLVRLGDLRRAQRLFLDEATASLECAHAEIKFAGNVPDYVTAVARLVFGAVHDTASEFKTLFGTGACASALVAWASDQMVAFADTFSRVVFAHIDYAVIAQCIETALSQARRTEAAGLSLTFLLDARLRSGLNTAVSGWLDRTKGVLSSYVAAEKWHSREMRVVDPHPGSSPTVKLSESAKFLYLCVTQFVSNVALVAHLDLYDIVVSGIVSLVEGYVGALGSALADRATDKQAFVMMGNVASLATQLVPKVSAQIASLFDMVPYQLTNLSTRLLSAVDDLIAAFAAARAPFLVTSKLHWDEDNYGTTSISHSDASPSRPFAQFFSYLCKMRSAVDAHLHPDHAHTLVLALCLQVARDLARYVPGPSGPPNLAFGGLQQLVLDLRFFARAVAAATDPDAASDAEIVSRVAFFTKEIEVSAVARYASSTGNDIAAVLKSEKWFDQGVARGIASLDRMGWSV